MPLVLTEAEGRPAVNASYFSSINPVDGKCLQEKYSNRFHDCDFGLLANLYACEGKPGKVRTIKTLLSYHTDRINDETVNRSELLLIITLNKTT